MSMTTQPTTAAEQFARRGHSPLERVQHVLHSHPTISPAVVLIVSFIVFSLFNERFFSPAVASTILQQNAIIATLAVGQTLVILTAGIDLSVGAAAIMAMMVAAKMSADYGLSGPVALLVALLVGTAAGVLNGLAVTRLRLPPFIVTLGTLSVFTAIALLYSKGATVRSADMPDLLNWTYNAHQLGSFRITNGIIVVVVLYVVVAFALSQTAWGRHVYAVGDDREAARLAGIRVDRVLLSVYAISGVIFGLTAWVTIGRSGAASPNAITEGNLESITAVVIGGTSLFGGRGVLLGTLLGALIIGVFRSGLSVAGVDDQWRVLAVGLLVISAVAIDQWIRKVKP